MVVCCTGRRKRGTYPERLEEPLVLAARVALLQRLFDGLLRVLTLRWLLEGVGGDGALEGLELKSVSCGEEVGVVDDLIMCRHIFRMPAGH